MSKRNSTEYLVSLDVGTSKVAAAPLRMTTRSRSPVKVKGVA